MSIVSPNPQRRAPSSIEAEISRSWSGSHPTGIQQLAQIPPENYFDTPLGLVTLNDISQSIHRSDSWMYENNLVPIYDPRGNHVNADKAPPFPWEQLPAPRIKVGKKQWLDADIHAWIKRFAVRTSSQMDAIGDRRISRRVAQ